jgi:hypothetical protein
MLNGSRLPIPFLITSAWRNFLVACYSEANLGRPALAAVQTRPTYVAFRRQGKAPGPLPKGLLPVPDQHPILRMMTLHKGALTAPICK